MFPPPASPVIDKRSAKGSRLKRLKLASGPRLVSWWKLCSRWFHCSSQPNLVEIGPMTWFNNSTNESLPGTNEWQWWKPPDFPIYDSSESSQVIQPDFDSFGCFASLLIPRINSKSPFLIISTNHHNHDQNYTPNITQTKPPQRDPKSSKSPTLVLKDLATLEHLQRQVPLPPGRQESRRPTP